MLVVNMFSIVKVSHCTASQSHLHGFPGLLLWSLIYSDSNSKPANSKAKHKLCSFICYQTGCMQVLVLETKPVFLLQCHKQGWFFLFLQADQFSQVSSWEHPAVFEANSSHSSGLGLITSSSYRPDREKAAIHAAYYSSFPHDFFL